ncbi:MAG: MATE family efflux transporter [Rhodocyclaceae bacterium]|nr:MAG: MATE family efflux transporter [Rhodocyclaceae bacterium]
MRELVRLAWPVFIAQIAIIANGMIDTVMAGRLSPQDLAAIGIGAAIFASVFITSTGVLLAVTPTVAHLFGAGRHGEIGEEVRQAAWLALGLLLLVEVLFLFPEPLLAISKLSPDMEHRVRDYLGALAWYAPAAMVLRLFHSASSGLGLPRPAMMLSLLTLALKAPLNWVFMYGHFGFPALGATGCGVASACASWIAAGIACYWWATWADYRPYGIFTRWNWPRPAAIKALLKLGLPIGATFLVDVTAFTFMALFIARLGPTASGAHQIAANLSVLCFMLPTAIGHAAGVLTGQALGARQPLLARQAGLRGFALGMGCTVVLALLLALNNHRLAGFYTSDPAVQALAASLILLIALYHLTDGLQSIAVNLLRGYKKATAPMVIYAVALWGVGLAGGVLLGLTDWLGPARGAAGFWMAGTLALLLAGVAVAGYWWHISLQAVVVQNKPAATNTTP